MQVQSYLRFAKLKRAQHVREAVAVITEFKDDRITSGVRRIYLINTITHSI